MSLFQRVRQFVGAGASSDTEDDEQDISDKLSNLSTADPPTNAENSVKKNALKENRQAQDALNILHQITGKSNTELCSLLYRAQILGKERENYAKIVEYIRNGQEHGFGIQVMNIIRIVRNNDFEFAYNPAQNSSKAPSDQFRMILVHGTKKKYVSSILAHGFAKPPNKKQMFGTGIYFADRASKSGLYCDSTSAGSIGYLFICDVKVGKMYKAKNPHNDMSGPPAGFNSVKCVGKRIPDWDCSDELNGACLPSGPTRDNARFQSYSVNFNEYVIYEPERIKVKYLVVVHFQSKPC